ncbi:uncharacterized protein LOC115891817 [Sitophilus oryzae]|uniref:Uncharacterized protein LOC115891817 n=1 Tax=Sitophilus oryzae TaxID=7048 RepID=A0A6J2YZJ8_SITOR|nr:uncharacterized protein LOC115891817 [Sitophilus oryzae]
MPEIIQGYGYPRTTLPLKKEMTNNTRTQQQIFKSQRNPDGFGWNGPRIGMGLDTSYSSGRTWARALYPDVLHFGSECAPLHILLGTIAGRAQLDSSDDRNRMGTHNCNYQTTLTLPMQTAHGMLSRENPSTLPASKRAV